MYSKSISNAWKDTRGCVPLTAAALAVMLLTLVSLLFFIPAAQAADAPTFVYQTVFNGAQFDSGSDEVVDEAGNAYVLANTYDPPTTSSTNNDVMIVKLSPSGAVLFATHLRGSMIDVGTGLTLDGHGGLLVCGWTDSSDFPVVNAAQPTKDARRSAFLARLSTVSGAVVYSSYFGANGVDEFHDVTVNAAGEIFLVGKTDSTDFPTLNPIQAHLNTATSFQADAFIVHLSPDAHTIVSSTYLGGELVDQADSIGLDATGNIYVAGITKSNSFPTANPFQAARSGDYDVWAARISSDGAHLDYSTYLGGSNTEYLGRIAVDTAGNVTLAGTTNSRYYPTTPDAYQPTFGGGVVGTAGFGQRAAYDAFVTRLTPDGSSLVYSTFLGGANDDQAHGVAIDGAGNAYVVGYHISEDTPPSANDIVVSCLDASGAQLLYQVSEWSAVANGAHGIALGPDGDVYYTGAKNVPSDLYAARLADGGSPPPPMNGILHVGDLDGSSISSGKSNWRATVTVLVHDAAENPIADVTVKGVWSGGYSGNAQIVTDANGRATMTTANLRGKVKRVTFTVTSLTKSGSTYSAAANHDPDGDSNGTSIVVPRP